MSKQARDGLELELSSHDLYPPYTSERAAWVYITTQAPGDPAVVLDFTVNGESGKFYGLGLVSEPTGGMLTLHRAFIESYGGTWPVEIVVTAKLDQLEESATLTLYDTRQMQAARAQVSLTPSAVVQIPPSGGTGLAVVNSAFYDAGDIELPHDELDWQVALNPPVAGVELKDRTILVSSMPHADKVQVLVSGPNGVTGNATLTLVK